MAADRSLPGCAPMRTTGSTVRPDDAAAGDVRWRFGGDVHAVEQGDVAGGAAQVEVLVAFAQPQVELVGLGIEQTLTAPLAVRVLQEAGFNASVVEREPRQILALLLPASTVESSSLIDTVVPLMHRRRIWLAAGIVAAAATTALLGAAHVYGPLRAAIALLVALLVALFIALKKVRSRHHAGFIAMIALVVLVMFLFLQNWRTTLIPAITIPVSLVGTFGVMWFCGFSLNNLTLSVSSTKFNPDLVLIF